MCIHLIWRYDLSVLMKILFCTKIAFRNFVNIQILIKKHAFVYDGLFCHLVLGVAALWLLFVIECQEFGFWKQLIMIACPCNAEDPLTSPLLYTG